MLDFCAVEVLLAVVDEGFFFGGADALSCANSLPLGKTSEKASRSAEKRLGILTLFSVARFPAPAFV